MRLNCLSTLWGKVQHSATDYLTPAEYGARYEAQLKEAA